MAVIAENASVPPIHTGFVTQYRKLLTAPARCPKARRVHRYGPPSCGNAVPSSANSKAWGTKKVTAKTIIQVKASPPLEATDAIVSTPTIVHTRKNRMSNRPKCFLSFAFSATSASVAWYGKVVGADIGQTSVSAEPAGVTGDERIVWGGFGCPLAFTTTPA
jgi:hypothetical protein